MIDNTKILKLVEVCITKYTFRKILPLFNPAPQGNQRQYFKIFSIWLSPTIELEEENKNIVIHFDINTLMNIIYFPTLSKSQSHCMLLSHVLTVLLKCNCLLEQIYLCHLHDRMNQISL